MPAKKKTTEEKFSNKEYIEKNMVAVSHVQKCINTMFTAFVQHESGNKITQFNMQGLGNLLMTAIQNPGLPEIEPPKNENGKKE